MELGEWPKGTAEQSADPRDCSPILPDHPE